MKLVCVWGNGKMSSIIPLKNEDKLIIIRI